MPKAKPEPAPILAYACKCAPEVEMECTGKPTMKMFRKFFCPQCHTTIWMSASFFNRVDGNQEIMERST